MKLPRRTLFYLASGAVALPALSRLTRAQAYPSRPVRIVVGFAPGGPNDINARLIGQWLSERLGQQFIVDNRPGASGNIAMESVVKSPPDGYTLVMVATSSAANATLYDNLPFNFLRDIAPVGGISGTYYALLAHPSVPAKTLPARIASFAYQNKAVVYDLLFKASSQAVLTIAADPEHLGVRIGITAVLHTWGSTMTHHPHVHMIVPGGGISLDGSRWLSCQPRFLLPVPVLTKLFQGLMLAKLLAAHKAGRLSFFGPHAHLAERRAFAAYLAPLRRITWYVYAKPPFGGPKAVLAYLARYTHRVAIANSRLLARDQQGVTFRYKDYRADGRARQKVMTLATSEFIRRFLLHVLPHGFHRIRHYGLLARPSCADNIARARELLALTMPQDHNADAGAVDPNQPTTPSHLCPCCGGRMITIEIFKRGSTPRHRPTGPITAIRIDTS